MRLERVDSTNRYVADAARTGAAEGLVVVADEQEAGRGRLGRRWVAPPGSALLCSVLLRPPLALTQLHLVSLAMALAGRAAIAAAAGVAVDLKWPNDLLAGERKLGGILAEVVETPGQPRALVVGIGINLDWPSGFGRAPEEKSLRESATTLGALGAAVDRDALLEALLDALAPRYGALSPAEGREELLAEYRSACATIGRRVRVLEHDGAFEGRAVAVDPFGRLIVTGPFGERAVDAGDVVHLLTPGRE